MRRWLAVVAFSAVLLRLIVAGGPCDAGERLQFSARPPQVDDQSTHDIKFQIDLKLSIRETGRTIYSSDRDVKRVQRRDITILKTDGGRTTQVRVHFETSNETATQAGHPPKSAQHPVTGKTYLVSRDGERLVVTDPSGQEPPPEELAIVARGMDGIGRVNPLTQFLNRRTIAIGETVKLPGHAARELFGLGDAVGTVADFEMKLTGTHDLEGAKCGVFEAVIDAKSDLATNMRMQITGRFWIEIDTCRTLAADLSGPVTISEVQVSQSGQFNTTGKGNIRAALRARHGQVRR